MNYLDPEWSIDGFETLSPIYVRDATGSHILIESCLFEGNIGLHGGALHFDLGAADASQVIIRNSTFTKNMAYFEGNAIYAKGDSNVSM